MKKTFQDLPAKNENNEVSNNSNHLNALTKPGDKMSARVTDSYRKVVKVETNNGNNKYSATQYPNGTIVETKTTKNK